MSLQYNNPPHSLSSARDMSDAATMILGERMSHKHHNQGMNQQLGYLFT
jgi:hypothetical protein